MKNFKCLIGFHKYEELGYQYGPYNIVYGWTETRATRMIERCERCQKINKIEIDLTANVKDDESILWEPTIKTLIKNK